MKMRYLAIAVSVAALSACATKPKPEPVAEAPVVQAPAPVTTRPAPTGPVTAQPTAPVVQDTFVPPVPGSLEDFVYQSGQDRIYFGYDRYDLSAEARDVLKKQADWLNQYGQVNAIVAGNADERGTREYNLALGARRADSVKSYLVSQGVNPSRLTTVSYGKERPIDPRSNEAGWAINRNGHTNLQGGVIG